MIRSDSNQRPWPLKLTGFAGVAGMIAIVLLLVAGPAYRVGVLPLMPSMLLTAVGFLLCALAFLLGVIGLIARRGRRPRVPVKLLMIILIAAGVTLLAVFWATRLSGVPPIHEITTDLQDPPPFKDVIPLRIASGALNPPEYKGIQEMAGKEIDVRAAQRAAYPDIQSLLLQQPPSEAMRLAQQAVQDLGWELVNAVPAEGRIEATDTTTYFGFKDDVVIRIRPQDAGSRVDLRSKSRVGGGDAGTNARRVRDFLSQLRALSAE